VRLNDSRRELLVAGLAIVLIGSGIVVGAAGPTAVDVARPTADRLFVERAAFCPAAPAETNARMQVVAGPATDQPLLVDVDQDDGPATSLERNILALEPGGHEALSIIGFGGTVSAAIGQAFLVPFDALAAGNCIPDAGTRWYFPYGSSAFGFNERLVLYNPFPDEAVVRVSFLMKDVRETKSSLAEVPVPSGEVVSLKLNEYLLQERILGVEIAASRGRVAAWKVLFAKVEGLERGAALTPGTGSTSPEWYFPEGLVAKGADTRISVLNPLDEEARVTVSVVGDEKVIQPPALVDVRVAGGTSDQFSLREVLEGETPGPVSVIVRSTNGVGVVAESSVWYDGDYEGFTSEIGAPLPETRWSLGSPGIKLDGDAVVLLNVGQEPAVFDISLRTTAGEPIRHERLSDLHIPAGARLRVSLDRFLETQPTIAFVEASAPVVAERVGYSRRYEDTATIMGMPLGR